MCLGSHCMLYLIAITAGIFWVAFLSSLPSFWVVGTLWALLFIGYWAVRSRPLPLSCIDPARLILIVLLFVCGLAWGLKAAHQTLSSQLPDKFDRQEFIVMGTIVGLVDRQDGRLGFELATESVLAVDNVAKHTYIQAIPLRRLLLSWYFEKDLAEKPQLRAGDHWQLRVKLRRPRGMLNQGGFDYQAWLVEQGYSATGYVVPSSGNYQIQLQKQGFWGEFSGIIARLREDIREAIQSSQLKDLSKAVITALTIGDKSALTPWWDSLARFGIVHLLVISGLHIGLVASLGFYLGVFICRIMVVSLNLLSVNLPHFGLIRFTPPIVGFSVALIYSFLAGFSLPTQRALIAVAVVMLAKLTYQKVQVGVAFVWAIFLIAVFQPLAVLSASFWLSFTAVGLLLVWFSPYISSGSRTRRLLGSQLVLFAGLAAPGLLFIGKISWLGVLVNLIAVPWVSIVTVPLCLLAGIGYLVYEPMADWLWLLASWSIGGLWHLLEYLPDELGLIYLPVPLTPIFLSAVIMAAVALLMPRGIWARWLCFVPVGLAILAPDYRSPLRLSVLDVGQGLAVVLESSNKLLVYDAGPTYSDRFNAGAGIVAPFLRSRGRHAIDKLLISHGDSDHAGGFYSLIGALETKQALLAPDFYRVHKLAANTSISVDQCIKSKHWKWSFFNPQSKKMEWLYFDVLMPNSLLPQQKIPSRNNYSCVLLVRWRDQVILLAGDIERAAERELLRLYKLPRVTVLVAPHHGSNTSSSQSFVDQLNPIHVVFSAGFRHHFGHPHPQVVQRYKNVGASLWNTADWGGVTFIWDHNAQLQVMTARQAESPYWWR